MHLFTTKKKKHQDTHAHNFTMQFTELMYRFKDLYQIVLFITMKPNEINKHAS